MMWGSIRTRLIALVAVVATPFVLVVAWTSVSDYREAVLHARMEALTVADLTGTATAQFLGDALRQLEGVAETLGPELLTPATCGRAVAQARTLASFSLDVAFFEPSGTPLCSTREAPQGVSPAPADPDWLRETLAQGRPRVGDPVQGPYSGIWLVPFLVPVRGDDGSVAGVLGASVALDRFQTLLTGVPKTPDAVITIADGAGRVIARSHAPEEHVGRVLPTYESLGWEVDTDRWVSLGADFQGVYRSWGRVDLPGQDWHVYAGIPVDTIMGPARRQALRRAAVVGLILLLGLGAGFFIQGGIAGSLSHLTESVRAAAAGGGVVIPRGGPVELEEVVDQLNRTLMARDEAQAHAQQAQSRFQSILENAVMGIFISAGTERFLHVNPALVEMLGYATADELRAVGPAHLFPDAASRRAFAKELEARSVFRQLETEWLRRDGSRITVELTGRILTGDDGETLLEVHVQDVTAQKRFDRELRQTQKMEAVGRLAGGVAHDFNNLLTVISGNLLLALDEPGLPPSIAPELQEASEASDRAAVLTRKLLAFSRKDRPEPRVVDGNEMVVNIQKLLERLIPERIELLTSVTPLPTGVVGDLGQLEQVVMNLVLNARDSIQDTGRIEVTTEIAAESPDPTHQAGPDGWFVLTVRDSGAGMSEEVRSRIFEPFFTTKPSGEGTGLGLATVHAIVTQAGGHVRVDSTPSVGTSFQVWLPAVPPETGPRTADREAGTLWARGETVLVVEDEESVRTTVTRILERMGYRVLTADDGAEGLGIVEAGLERVDLVLSDVVMPSMGGVEVYRALARLAPDVPVVLMSGYTTELPPIPTHPDGVSHFLAKPFTPAQLLERVRSVLDARPVGA